MGCNYLGIPLFHMKVITYPCRIPDAGLTDLFLVKTAVTVVLCV